MTQLRCDVLIVGSGAAGPTLAATLAERTSLRIVLAERGAHYPAAFYDQREIDMNVLYADDGARTTADGQCAVEGGSCVGGGTSVGYAACVDPVEAVWNDWRTSRGVTGFSFAPNAADYGVRGLNFAIALADVRARIGAHAPGPSELNDNNRLFAAGCAARGIASGHVDLAMRECLFCGFCAQGCAYDRKQSTAITYVRDAVGRGVQLVHHCTIERVVLDAQRRGVRAIGATGTVAPTRPGSLPNSLPPGPVDIRARLVIVCAGAIETPALLQRSSVPDPFSNIGAGLVLHPSLPVGAIFDRPLASERGVTMAAYSDAFRESHGIVLEAQFDHPVDTALAVPTFGLSHFNIMQAYARLGGCGVRLIDTLDAGNRVDWNPATGRASIEYRLAEADAARLRFGAERAVEIMFAAGAREVFLGSEEPLENVPWPHFTALEQAVFVRSLRFDPYQTHLRSAHAQSTVKLGEDPRICAVNSRCEVNGVSHLMACDASSFPTSCGANPMLAVMALARYQGLRIAAEWSRYT